MSDRLRLPLAGREGWVQTIGTQPDRSTGLLVVPRLLVSLLAWAAPAVGQAVPPPTPQLQADCTRPQYASDTLACADAVLTAMDTEVANLAGTPPRLAAGAIWEDQAAWLRRRSTCAFRVDHRDCLVAAYTDRGTALGSLGTPSTMALECGGPWRGRRLRSSAIVAGRPIVFREAGLLLGVATSSAAAQWQPALAWRATRRGIRVQAQGGDAFDCRLVTG